jgi:hypothetical protein
VIGSTNPRNSTVLRVIRADSSGACGCPAAGTEAFADRRPMAAS